MVGGAQLNARGLIGGTQQDAVFSLTDFPAVLLQPLYSALPALQVGLELCCVVCAQLLAATAADSGQGGQASACHVWCH